MMEPTNTALAPQGLFSFFVYKIALNRCLKLIFFEIRLILLSLAIPINSEKL